MRSFDFDIRLIWIDGICIDQRNAAERSQQVLLMKDIYANSARTIIWLGPATTDSFRAMLKLFQLSISWEERCENARTEPLKAENRAVYQQFLRADVSEDDTDDLLGISRLFLRSWWTRAWIVQELAVSVFSYMLRVRPLCPLASSRHGV
jgi:hypothetical protein